MRNYVKRAVSASLILLLGGMMMFGLFGCGEKKYKVDCCGQEDCYSNLKKSYKAGEQVELFYELIATDTDYSFYLDGEYINYRYDDKHGFVISFVMPEHDVKLECVMKNSMEYDPEVYLPNEDVMLIDYYTATVGTDGYDDSAQRVLYEYSSDQAKLVVNLKNANGEETAESYLVPCEAVERCYEIIRENQMSTWNDTYDNSIDGAVTAVRFRQDDGSYVRVSTDAMPDGGEAVLDSIGIVMGEYIKEEYKMQIGFQRLD